MVVYPLDLVCQWHRTKWLACRCCTGPDGLLLHPRQCQLTIAQCSAACCTFRSNLQGNHKTLGSECQPSCQRQPSCRIKWCTCQLVSGMIFPPCLPSEELCHRYAFGQIWLCQSRLCHERAACSSNERSIARARLQGPLRVYHRCNEYALPPNSMVWDLRHPKLTPPYAMVISKLFSKCLLACILFHKNLRHPRMNASLVHNGRQPLCHNQKTEHAQMQMAILLLFQSCQHKHTARWDPTIPACAVCFHRAAKTSKIDQWLV